MSLIHTAKDFVIKTLGGTTEKEQMDSDFNDFMDLEKGFSPRGLLEYGNATSSSVGTSPDISFNTLYRIYEQETWVRACVDAIKRGVISQGWEVTATFDEPSDTSEEYLRHFFAYPNPDDSMEDIVGDMVTDLMTYGNTFLEVVRDGSGLRVKEIWNLDATTMRIKHDKHGVVLGYLQVAGGETVEFSPDQVIHIKLTSKGSSVYGLSPLKTLIMAVDTDLKAQIYTAKYFENFGAPKALFKFKNASAEQVKRNRIYIATSVAGVENAHKNLILEGDVEYEPLSTDFKDTKALEVRRYLRDEIFAVYGVPPSKVAVIESGNIGGGTGEAQDKTFKVETIIPLQKKIAQKLNHKLVKGMMGIFDYEFAFKDVLETDKMNEARIHDIYVKNGVMTVNEVREEIGLEPLEEVAKDDPTANDPTEEPIVPQQGTARASGEDGRIPSAEKKLELHLHKGDEETSNSDMPVLAIKKGLGLDFNRFEPMRERFQRIVSEFAQRKSDEIVTNLEEQGNA